MPSPKGKRKSSPSISKYKYTKKERIRRWLRYGVFWTLAPVGLTLLLDAFVGYSFEQVVKRHILDFLLVVFAIACGVYSSASDIERKVVPKVKEKHGGIAVTCGGITSVTYSLLYIPMKFIQRILPDINLGNLPENILQSLPDMILYVIYIFSAIAFVILIHSGIEIERHAYDG